VGLGVLAAGVAATSRLRFPTNDERARTMSVGARAVEALLPEALVELGDLDLAAAPRREDEAVFAEVDADVGEGEAARVEEHEVARLEVGERDLVADAAHRLRGAGQLDPGDLLEDVAHESAAVEAGLRRFAAG
jgi:hypothetical protein